MIIEDALDFLRETPPLGFLAPDRLAELARLCELEFTPAGRPLAGPGEPGTWVRAVCQGRVRAGGAVLGAGAFVGWTPGPATALDDTVCCLVPREALARAVAGREDLEDFLAGRFTARVLEMGLSGLARGLPAWAAGRPLASVTAGEAARGRDLSVHLDASLEQAARLMTRADAGAVLVTDGAGAPCGVVTDRDFRAKAAARGLGPETPVETVMSAPVLSVGAGESCFEALLVMTRHAIRHVVVLEGCRVVGLVSARQLLLIQAGSPPVLAGSVNRAGGPAELARAAADLEGLALGLLREGARAASLGRIVGGLRERLAARAAELVRNALGDPPAPFALAVFGAAARRDGPALCPMPVGVIHDARREGEPYFRAMLDETARTLEACGLGGLPVGCRGPEDWRERMLAWAAGGEPGADPGLLDFRPVSGRLRLAEALRARTTADLGRDRAVLAGLAERIGPVQTQDPGVLFATLTDMTRVLGLAAGLPRIGSLERAGDLGRVLPLGPELARDFENALGYLAARQWLGPRASLDALALALTALCAGTARALERFLPGREGAP